MAYITVGKENSADIELYFEDRGSGPAVVLVHGWPENGGAWERQAWALLAAGFRVITYDRRGFGRSSATDSGYDFDTMAADLAAIITATGVKDAALVGFSMGGGEVARYMGKFGGKNIAKCVFISTIAPALRKGPDNPDGVDAAIFEGMKDAIRADRYLFLDQFMHMVFEKKVSEQAIRAYWNIGAQSSYGAMLKCVDAWLEDFRADVAAIKSTVPTLVLHGDADNVVPADASGKRMKQFVKHAQVQIIKDAPHLSTWSHANEVNAALIAFLRG